MSKEVIIFGASGHGRVIADIVKKSGDIFIGYLDDDLSKPGVIGCVEECTKYRDKHFVIGIGNNAIRKRIAESYPDINYYTAIHPTAVCSTDVMIGDGTVVMAKAVINAGTNIGKHCIINTASVIEHDNILEDYVHISPNATLCGTVAIGKCTHIGAGAVVKNNINIKADCVIGCGACVIKDITDSGIYVGVPANKLS